MFRSLFLVMVFGAVVGFGQSNPTTPVQPTKLQADPKQNSGGIIQRGTENAPVVVQLINPTAGTQLSEDKTPDWWMVGLTAGLLLVAGCQLWYFVRQLRIMERTIQDAANAGLVAERAARAAEDSVKAMQTSTEQNLRAYVSIKLEELPEVVADENINFKFACTNRGPTPAFELGFRAQFWVVAPFPEPPEMPILSPITGIWNEKRANIFQEETACLSCASQKSFDAATVYSVQINNAVLLLGIEVKYLDIFKRPHISREYYSIVGTGVNRITALVAGGSYADVG